MALCKYSSALLPAALLVLSSVVAAHSQVFVVGEKTATADIATDFRHTDVSIPDARMTERGRRELIRNLEAEQGFAHRALPMGGTGLVLQANGPLTPGPAEYKRMLYEKGQSAAAGDRVYVTAIEVKLDRIVLDINGGPYLKHRFLRHVSINDAPVVRDTGELQATGARVTLVFEGGVPEVSAPEVKALLAPVIDFGVKSSDQAYADTLPPELRDHVAAHEVLVGMNHRMVLAALGQPESKVRDQPSGDVNNGSYEEWIYGHVPQTVRFIRFVGDRVTLVEIAALGQPLEIHDKDEVGELNPASLPTREIAMGDQTPSSGDSDRPSGPPPTLRKPGEPVPAGGSNKVQFPGDSKPSAPTTTSSTSSVPPSSQLR